MNSAKKVAEKTEQFEKIFTTRTIQVRYFNERKKRLIKFGVVALVCIVVVSGFFLLEWFTYGNPTVKSAVSTDFLPVHKYGPGGGARFFDLADVVLMLGALLGVCLSQLLLTDGIVKNQLKFKYLRDQGHSSATIRKYGDKKQPTIRWIVTLGSMPLMVWLLLQIERIIIT